MNQRNRIPYEVARHSRPNGSCYCDLDDEACYNAGHWTMVNSKLKVEIDITDEAGKTVEVSTLYDIPVEGASRAIRIASVVERLMDKYPAYSAIIIQITKDG